MAGHRSSNAMHIVLRVRWSIVIHHQSDLQMQRIFGWNLVVLRLLVVDFGGWQTYRPRSVANMLQHASVLDAGKPLAQKCQLIGDMLVPLRVTTDMYPY